MKEIYLDGKIMQDYIKVNNLTIKKFCEMCNIKYYNYRQIMKNDTKVLISVLFNVVETIGVPLSEIVKI